MAEPLCLSMFRAMLRVKPALGGVGLVALCGLWLALYCLCVPTRALAQHDGIFNRFDSERAAPEAWQAMGEVPVFLRPQMEADADITKNLGANLVVSFRPRNRVYFSRSYGFAQMEWEPVDSSVDRVLLTTMEISEILNVSIKRVVIWNFGLGLGLMNGIIHFGDGDYRTRYEPYLPIQTGLGFYPHGPFMIELKLWHGFFLGPGPVVSATRALVGIGYNF